MARAEKRKVEEMEKALTMHPGACPDGMAG
jgi:hypothetical protein